jgi:hypothetical protein
MSNGISQHVKKDQYIKTLAKEIRSVPNKVLAAAAIAGFKAAVRHTYMDSGQFAMNWQIYVGSRPRFVGAIRYRTKDGPIKRGNQLTAKGMSDKVFSTVMSRKGLPKSPYAHYTGTELYNRIANSRVKKISISNPFWDSRYGSESYVRGGRSGYPANAAVRPGHMVDKAIRQAATRAAHTALKRLEKGK